MSPELNYSTIQEYVISLVPQRPDELLAMEAKARKDGFPIIGPAAGQICYLITRLHGARRVFEMGSGFGYSTAWFAKGVRENGGGEVYHVVWDQDLSSAAQQHLSALGYRDLVQYRIGEAIALLQETPGQFDLIFNDIDKEGYPASLEVIEKKLKPGGILLVDNMFLGGRIFDSESQSASKLAVEEFILRIKSRAHWQISVIPIRDGVLLAIKD